MSRNVREGSRASGRPVDWRLLSALAAAPEAVENGGAVPALSVARLQSFYDGTLFYKLAREHA